MTPIGLPPALAEAARAAGDPVAPSVASVAGRYGTGEVLADMEAAVALMRRVCAGVDVDAAVSWQAEDRQAILRLFDQAVDGFTTGRGTFLVAEQRAGTWQGSGDRSFETFRVRTSGTAPRAAAVQVRQAEHLAAAPEAAAAVAGGTIGFEHAAVIARLAATGSPAQQQALAAGGRDELLGWARRQDAGTFATTAARWAAEHDPVRLESDHQAQRRERYLHLSMTDRGTVIKGLVDAMAGHRLRLALEAVTPRPAKDDDRSPGQRGADALDTMATAILSSADTKPGAHVPPHVSLIMSADTFVAARAHRDRQRAAQAGAGAPEEDAAPRTYAPVTSEDGTPVPVSEAAVVLCDCAVTRVGIDAAGVPMDLGRTQRLFSGEQRRAILARDRECAWATCHMSARWLQIHHRVWWERDGGTTCVEDGVAMCSFHHHEVHRLDLVIIRILGEPADGPPGRQRRRPSGEIAMVGYEFRDRAGRVVATSAAGGGTSPPNAGLAGADLAARRDPGFAKVREAHVGALPTQRGPTCSSPPVS